MKTSNLALTAEVSGYNGSGTEVKFTEPSWSVEWIETHEALVQCCLDLVKEPLLGIDTETIGWQIGQEQLALIQIGIPSQEHVLVIDALAIKDLSPLDPVLNSAKPELVAHNAPFEERQFGRHGMKMRGIIDTLSMARKLRPDLPNHTLQTCCRYLLNSTITKEQQASDWSIRPLSPEQLKYAALDAEIAISLYKVLAEMESRLVLDPKLGVPELMREISQTVSEKFELTKEISAELAFLNARYDMLRDTIRTKLVEGAKSYDGDYGSCKVTRVKQTEVDPKALREKYPDVAEEVITEMVDRKKLQIIAKEHKIEAEEIDRITNITGFVDRLSLSVKTV